MALLKQIMHRQKLFPARVGMTLVRNGYAEIPRAISRMRGDESPSDEEERVEM